MLDFVLSKTLFRKYSYAKELSKLNHGIVIIKLLVLLISLVILCGPIIFIVLPITLAVKLSIQAQIIILIPFVIYHLFLFAFQKYFYVEMLDLSNSIQVKLHFKLYTTKGEAISRQDFDKLYNNNQDLYSTIRYNLCSQYCINSCFKILKFFTDGEMWFIASKRLSNDEDLPYYFHVIYVKNGWVFDTDTNQQFLIDEFYEIRSYKIFKKFTFQEIENLEYEEFLENERPGIDLWCKENNCSTLGHS